MEISNNKRTDKKVDNAKRAELLDLLHENISIKQASTQLGINYENAKAIYRVWRIQKRKSKQLVRKSRVNDRHRPFAVASVFHPQSIHVTNYGTAAHLQDQYYMKAQFAQVPLQSEPYEPLPS